ncbi:phage holin family protein [Thalassotalea mangrovi]|uniref:Phage holin family protein n=1 Tax=Thalassotalea mangrovi TaxID=2572245 RepID=A0A4U1B3H9_9GAMM|nr:phage holin family protein [Thalassotalea mangrovi]TKB44491.1 phage holin family protein [Thalassotalea mangrovi]
MGIITNILLLSISIFLVSKMMSSIHLKSFWTAVVVAIVYSIADILLFWLLVIISMPLIIISFGLFVFILNAFLLWLTDQLLDDFEIESFGATIVASFIITVINLVLGWIFLPGV